MYLCSSLLAHTSCDAWCPLRAMYESAMSASVPVLLVVVVFQLYDPVQSRLPGLHEILRIRGVSCVRRRSHLGGTRACLFRKAAQNSPSTFALFGVGVPRRISARPMLCVPPVSTTFVAVAVVLLLPGSKEERV